MDVVLLYYAGFGAGIFYLLGDIIGGLITPNYNYIRNAVSELIQSGAENRRFLSVFMFLHAVMIMLFAAGILTQHSFDQSKLILIGGLLLLAVGLSHYLSCNCIIRLAMVIGRLIFGICATINATFLYNARGRIAWRSIKYVSWGRPGNLGSTWFSTRWSETTRWWAFAARAA